MPPPSPLDTDRLHLRAMTLDDVPFIAEILGDPETMRFYPRVYSCAEAQGWVERTLERYEEHGHAFWLVEERATGAPVGQVGLLMQFVEERWQPEIGYLIHRQYWRRGFASEAAIGVRDWAFTVRGVPEVISLIGRDNLPSQGVARKAGLVPAREALFHDRPHLIFALSREAWQALVPGARS